MVAYIDTGFQTFFLHQMVIPLTKNKKDQNEILIWDPDPTKNIVLA
jgi:hypothetical protein